MQRLSLAEIQGRSTLTVEETARLLGIGRSSAYSSVRRGEIPSLRLGKRIVVPVGALMRALDQRSELPGEEHPSASSVPTR